jgi:DNA polymerase-4
VVAACSYEARKFGVHSAMPMYLALQLCPEAKVISGDMEAYSQASHLVTDIIADSAPMFEKSSIDEFYIDASGMDKFFGAFTWAVELRKKIIKESDLPISLGMSVNKLVSKVTTAEFKPNASKHILPGTEKEFLAPLAVEKIPMIGKQTASFLYDMGVRTVSTLREMPLKFLISAFGKNGVSLWNKANGIDESPVVPYSEATKIMISLGAGIYEELVFRVLLVSGLMLAAKHLLGWGLRPSIAFAIVVGALVFSAFHYIGPYGDPWALDSFTFRAIAGLIFSGLYVARGFGIAAWTHALYDVMLALLR